MIIESIKSLIIETCESMAVENDHSARYEVQISRLRNVMKKDSGIDDILSVFIDLWSSNPSSNFLDSQIPNSLQLLQLACILPDISEKAISICVKLLIDGKINGRIALHCLSQIQSYLTAHFNTLLALRERLPLLLKIVEICMKPFLHSNQTIVDAVSSSSLLIQENNINNDNSKAELSLSLLPTVLKIISNLESAYDMNFNNNYNNYNPHHDRSESDSDKVLNIILHSNWNAGALIPLGNALCNVVPYLNPRQVDLIHCRWMQMINIIRGDDFAACMQICLRFYQKCGDQKWLHAFRQMFAIIPIRYVQTVEMLLEQSLVQYPIECNHLVDLLEHISIQSANSTIDKRMSLQDSDNATASNGDEVSTIPNTLLSLSAHDVRLLFLISRVTGDPQNIADCLPVLIGQYDETSISATLRLSRCLLIMLICGGLIQCIQKRQFNDEISTQSLLEYCQSFLHLTIYDQTTSIASSSSSSGSSSSGSSSSSSSSSSNGNPNLTPLDASLLGSSRTSKCISALLYATGLSSTFSIVVELLQALYLRWSSCFTKVTSKSDVDYVQLISSLFFYLCNHTRSAQSSILSQVVRGLIMCSERLKEQAMNNTVLESERNDLIIANAILHKTFHLLCSESIELLLQHERTIQVYTPSLVDIFLFDPNNILSSIASICAASRVMYDSFLMIFRKTLLKPTYEMKSSAIYSMVRLLPLLPVNLQKEIATILNHSFSMAPIYTRSLLIHMIEMMASTTTSLDSSVLKNMQSIANDLLIETFDHPHSMNQVCLSLSKSFVSYRSNKGLSYIMQCDIGLLTLFSWQIEVLIDREYAVKQSIKLIQFFLSQEDNEISKISTYNPDNSDEGDSIISNLLLGLLRFTKTGFQFKEYIKPNEKVDTDIFHAHIACCENVLTALVQCFTLTLCAIDDLNKSTNDLELLDTDCISEGIWCIGSLAGILLEICKQDVDIKCFQDFHKYCAVWKADNHMINENSLRKDDAYRLPVLPIKFLVTLIEGSYAMYNQTQIFSDGKPTGIEWSMNNDSYPPISCTLNYSRWVYNYASQIVDEVVKHSEKDAIILLKALKTAHEKLSNATTEEAVLKFAGNSAGKIFDLNKLLHNTKTRVNGVRQAVLKTENRDLRGHSLYAEISDLSDFGQDDSDSETQKNLPLRGEGMPVIEVESNLVDNNISDDENQTSAITSPDYSDMNLNIIERIVTKLPVTLQLKMGNLDIIGINFSIISKRRHITTATDSIRYGLFALRQELLATTRMILGQINVSSSWVQFQANEELVYWVSDLVGVVRNGVTQRTIKAYMAVIEYLVPSWQYANHLNEDARLLLEQAGDQLIVMLTLLNGAQPSLIIHICRTALHCYSIENAAKFCFTIIEGVTKREKCNNNITSDLPGKSIDEEDNNKDDNDGESNEVQKIGVDDGNGKATINPDTKAMVVDESHEADNEWDDDVRDNVRQHALDTADERGAWPERQIENVLRNISDATRDAMMQEVLSFVNRLQTHSEKLLDRSPSHDSLIRLDDMKILLKNLAAIINYLFASQEPETIVEGNNAHSTTKNNINQLDILDESNLIVERLLPKNQLAFLNFFHKYTKKLTRAFKYIQNVINDYDIFANSSGVAVECMKGHLESLFVHFIDTHTLVVGRGWIAHVASLRFPRQSQNVLKSIGMLKDTVYRYANTSTSKQESVNTAISTIQDNNNDMLNILKEVVITWKATEKAYLDSRRIRGFVEDHDEEYANNHVDIKAIVGRRKGIGLSRGRKRSRLRSRNNVIDSWLEHEKGYDTYADLEDWIVDEDDEEL